VLVEADVLPVARGARPETRPVETLGLDYRTSILGPADLVLGADFAVAKATVAECEQTIAEVVRWRKENQPGGSNAGSVFRNPVGDSAGRLIDETGLKGLRVGGAVVSPKHANFFQAEAGASAADVRGLMLEVQARVFAARGIELVPELRLLGFDDDEDHE
jgi:UDP-N-acetylmuramate dehydrogenase